MIFSYAPTDLIMFSKEVYLMVSQDYNSKYAVLSVALQIGHLASLVALILGKRTRQNLFLLLLLNLSSWFLMALVFFPLHFSNISWYWQWLSLLALFQALIVILASFNKSSQKRSRSYIINCSLMILFALLPLETLLLSKSIYEISMIDWGFLKVALTSLPFAFLIPTRPSIQWLSTVIPLLFVFHFILILLS